ncbi:MAG: TIGR04283 family arsenosugar biosynthesis glycosyltransferase [Elusimicrobia bacterium]|nr:TIGR04283 family arsenosugar biosynthesis glycosyltransferase [Candidatus Liberimonas magnetica]
MPIKFSVIVPVYKEEAAINDFIANLFQTARSTNFQVIIADGDPKLSTLDSINTGLPNLLKIAAKKGRAAQMNAAASHADGDVLLFLHADTKLPENAFDKITDALKDQQVIAGAFSLKLDSKNLFLRFVSLTASLRSKLTKIPFGDQAIFVRTSYFYEIGGFKNIPLMEDAEFMARIKKNGGKVKVLDSKAVSSARKWHKEGIVYNTIKNHLIRFLYFLGISPQRLYNIYYEK